MSSNRPVRILWEDAWSNDSSWNESEVKNQPPFLTETVGWLVHEDKHRITVAMEARRGKHSSQPYRHIQCIPKSLIRKRR